MFLSLSSTPLPEPWPFSLSPQPPASPHRPLPIPTSVNPFSVVVGDINGDGLPDILWGDVSVTPSVLHVLLAQIGGGYAPGTTVALPANATSEYLLTDFNRDHHLDLACTAHYTFIASVSPHSSLSRSYR
jgi:FG-GAP repeat